MTPTLPSASSIHGSDRLTALRGVTLYDAPHGDEFNWIPEAGCHLAKADLVDIFRSLRAMVDGTAPDEPNRSHIVSIAYVVSEAIERAGGDQ